MLVTSEQLRACLEYHPDSGLFTRHFDSGTAKAGDTAGWKEKHGYTKISVLGRKYYAHRLAWLYMTGEWPVGVDHINGVRDDNRWCNLREADQSLNMHNARKRTGTTSKHVGVNRHSDGRHFVAEITVGGKRHYLGCFKSEEDAAAARAKAKREYHAC